MNNTTASQLPSQVIAISNFVDGVQYVFDQHARLSPVPDDSLEMIGYAEWFTLPLPHGKHWWTIKMLVPAPGKGAGLGSHKYCLAGAMQPSNLGVFQAACVFVLHKGYGISVEDALGYGIILQAVEIATAFVMGAPALLKEGVSWRDVRLRAMHASPVELPPLPSRRGDAAVEVDA